MLFLGLFFFYLFFPILICFCFFIFYGYILNICLISKERQKGTESGQEMRGVYVPNILYECMKKVIFNKK